MKPHCMSLFVYFQNSVYDFQQPSLTARTPVTRNFATAGVKAKKMVKLSPLTMKLDKKQTSFSRFMAVPWEAVQYY